jgi:plasmid stabilization system protein ParE
MASVVWSPRALGDEARIAAYIAAENPVAAARVARELLVAGDSLVVFPRRGRPTSLPGRRELLAVRPFVLVNRILPGDVVDILRIWHAAQDRPGSL